MSTATVPTTLEITCPSWCTVDAQSHADDLWTNGGDCCHHGIDWVVPDPTGYATAMSEPRFHDPLEVSLTTVTSPDGREVATPVLYISQREHSIEQALALADAIRAVVETYRNGSES